MKKKLYSERFEIRLPEVLYHKSTKLARTKELTLSQLIRNLLADAVIKDTYKPVN